MGEKVQELDRISEGFIIQSFDLQVQESMRNSWGLFRDRRPDLYRNLTTLDGEPE
jgi:N-carbamoylputrescine amidase